MSSHFIDLFYQSLTETLVSLSKSFNINHHLILFSMQEVSNCNVDHLPLNIYICLMKVSTPTEIFLTSDTVVTHWIIFVIYNFVTNKELETNILVLSFLMWIYIHLNVQMEDHLSKLLKYLCSYTYVYREWFHKISAHSICNPLVCVQSCRQMALTVEYTQRGQH